MSDEMDEELQELLDDEPIEFEIEYVMQIVSATPVVSPDTGDRMIPANRKCKVCNKKLKDADVILRLAPGRGVTPFYIHDHCVLDLIAEARQVSDPMFERYRKTVIEDLDSRLN